MGLKTYKSDENLYYQRLEAGDILAGIQITYNDTAIGFQRYTLSPSACTEFLAQKLNHITFEVEEEVTLSTSLIVIDGDLYILDYQESLGVNLDNSIYRFKFTTGEGDFVTEPFLCIESESNWILADGTWNDEKIWIDEEVWID